MAGCDAGAALTPPPSSLPFPSAFIGFCSSFVSDCCSNSIRVIKTAKQAATTPVTYVEVVKASGERGRYARPLRN
jgi:hypothetical protein